MVKHTGEIAINTIIDFHDIMLSNTKIPSPAGTTKFSPKTRLQKSNVKSKQVAGTQTANASFASNSTQTSELDFLDRINQLTEQRNALLQKIIDLEQQLDKKKEFCDKFSNTETESSCTAVDVGTQTGDSFDNKSAITVDANTEAIGFTEENVNTINRTFNEAESQTDSTSASFEVKSCTRNQEGNIYAEEHIKDDKEEEEGGGNENKGNKKEEI
ncbi:hypothetical protein O3M35_007965 [Rhynocoris fuscipes]|uniref:Uncharacterized protein n=1 Tax=Rhynocoris fuscipes TaxID=488301 RepID=A0AAW1DDS5_9HEMI